MEMKDYELLEAQAQMMRMAEKYGIDDWRKLMKVRDDGNSWRLALGVVEGKPVFEGDELYCQRGVKYRMGKTMHFPVGDGWGLTHSQELLETFSWSPPDLRPGERYVGGIIHPDGRICHTFLLPGDDLVPDWDAGMRLAKGKGGDLPSRIEQAMMFSFMPEEFQKKAYWSNTQHAGSSVLAWYQNFNSGLQSTLNKSAELLVRAVRREWEEK